MNQTSQSYEDKDYLGNVLMISKLRKLLKSLIIVSWWRRSRCIRKGNNTWSRYASKQQNILHKNQLTHVVVGSRFVLLLDSAALLDLGDLWSTCCEDLDEELPFLERRISWTGNELPRSGSLLCTNKCFDFPVTRSPFIDAT